MQDSMPEPTPDPMTKFEPLRLRRRGKRPLGNEARSGHNLTLLDGVARGFYWQNLLDTGAMDSGSDIARAEGLHHSVVNELLRLTLLAPDILEMLMAGQQPPQLALIWFQRNPLPLDWAAQRQMLQGFEERA